MDEQKVAINGREVAFRRSAGAGRPVVLVHGNSSSSRTWEGLMSGEFGHRYQCLALDLPGHGGSAPAADPADYSAPGHAAVLQEFTRVIGVPDAVVVGWSLGGFVALEAASGLAAPGFAIFGTPPIGGPEDMTRAFLPNPAMRLAGVERMSEEEARTFAGVILAAGSPLPLEEIAADVHRTDGRARSGLFASLGEGRFADEVDIVAKLDRPLAVLHGDEEQVVDPAYLEQLTMPTLWRGAVQRIPGAGHSPQLEAPAVLADLLGRFVADLG